MRSRNIKPGLYKDDELAECSIWARYLFPGLWMLADKEGRLKDRPRWIKGEIFPFDNVDVDALLNELQEASSIMRYETNGIKCILISNFKRDQSPHKQEKESVLPAYAPEPKDTDKSHEISGLSQEKGGLESDEGTIPSISVIRYQESSISNQETPKDSLKFSESSEPYKLSLYLRSRILNNLPTARVPKDTPKALEGWSDVIDKIIRLDGRSLEDIRNMIDFATSDSFWSSNILSAGSLRDKFDKLQLQRRRKTNDEPTDRELNNGLGSQESEFEEFVVR